MAEPVITSIEFRESPSHPKRVTLGRRNRFDVFGENFTKDNAALIIEGLFGDFDVRWTRTRVRFIDSGHLDCDSRPDVGAPFGGDPDLPTGDDGDVTITVTNNDGPSPPFTDTVDYTTIPLSKPGDGKPAAYGSKSTGDLPRIDSVRFKESTNPKHVFLGKDNKFEITGEHFTDAGLGVTMSGKLDDGTPVNWVVKSRTRESGTLIKGKAKPTKGTRKGKGSGTILDDPGDVTVTVSNNTGPSPPFHETVDYIAQTAVPDTNGAGGSGNARRKKTV